MLVSEESAFVISFALVILMKVVCFILGYLTIRLGYKLISSGVKGEFKFEAQFAGLKADLASISPGLLFVLLGVFLIGYAIYVEKGITLTKESPVKIERPKVPIPNESPFDRMEEGENNEVQ